MMSDNLFDMLEYAALGTEWREWLKEVEKTADLVDLRRADTWTVLKQPAKNVHAVRWLTEELRKAATAPSPDDRTWCVLYLLAAHCRDNTALGYVRDISVHYYRTQHRAGELAARCHQSETVFRERFKEEFGQPVAGWLRERRKEDILAMLSDTSIPLSDIAVRNGFQSLSTLSDYCRRNFGKSPSLLRKDTAG